MSKFYFYCIIFLLAFALQSCDDDPVMEVMFPTSELILNEGESSKVIAYSIEDEKEGAEIVFTISDEELWSITNNPEKREIEVKCMTENAMSDIISSLTVQVMKGGKVVTSSELKILKKVSSKLSEDLFRVTPQVLEAVGGKVPVTINGKFPEFYFDENAVVEITPVLKWNGGEAKGSYSMNPFQGEKVEGNNQIISYRMGGSYILKVSFDYVPEMDDSELYLEFKATIGKKEIAIPAVKVADGVISTSE